MIRKEFLETSGNVFRRLGCKQYGKKFIYEHEDMYITFMLVKSKFSESYYHEFNFTIKVLHSGIKPSEITERDFDLLSYPRLRLSPKTIAIQLSEVDVLEYEKLLQNSLEDFLKNVNKKGLALIKDYEKNGCLGVPVILRENVRELLSKY